MTARRLVNTVLEAEDRMTIAQHEEPIEVAKIYLHVDDAMARIVVDECKHWYRRMVS